ncbi:MAG: isoprenyl transferase [Desulfobacterales bacterium]|nr:isoprenyl transferase [Desulfobacterales bacterium]MDJ0856482.1 isoprenyl transferase [Desulfobacterales bacterium]MDJ0886046.1 isoprenyl transferase [Desulfobacterales bacterium]
MSSKRFSRDGGELDPGRLPRHVAMIMDGNGRWAKKRLLNRIQGHEKGADTVRAMVEACREIGIPYLTLYAFSTENWQRPKREVDALMALLMKFIDTERDELQKNGIQLAVIGEIERLPEKVRRALDEVIAATAANDKLRLILALSYGGRAEIVRMARRLAEDAVSGKVQADQIDHDCVVRQLYTADIPDPDILIRTSGEMRISNFLLWQIAYAEFHFTPTLWPDFGKEEFYRILGDYQQRERRFGKVDAGAELV